MLYKAAERQYFGDAHTYVYSEDVIVCKSTIKFMGMLLLSMSFCGIAAAQGRTQSTLVSEASYTAESTEAQQVRQWLSVNAPFRSNSEIGNPAYLGDVTVVVTRTTSGMVRPSSPGDGPPVPLPSSGVEGDTIEVTSSSRGWTQTWSYIWRGGGWRLTAYRYYQTVPR